MSMFYYTMRIIVQCQRKKRKKKEIKRDRENKQRMQIHDKKKIISYVLLSMRQQKRACG